jgi:hypothetical protein
MFVRCNAAKPWQNCGRHRLGLLVLAVFLLPQAGRDAVAQARLSREDCRRVVEYVPAPSVAFQPGVGAGGRRVAPADLSPPQTIMPETPLFYLSIDLQQRFGLPAGIEAALPIGIVALDGNRLLLNGRPLGGEDQAALAAACAAARRRR